MPAGIRIIFFESCFIENTDQYPLSFEISMLHLPTNPFRNLAQLRSKRSESFYAISNFNDANKHWCSGHVLFDFYILCDIYLSFISVKLILRSEFCCHQGFFKHSRTSYMRKRQICQFAKGICRLLLLFLLSKNQYTSCLILHHVYTLCRGE